MFGLKSLSGALDKGQNDIRNASLPDASLNCLIISSSKVVYASISSQISHRRSGSINCLVMFSSNPLTCLLNSLLLAVCLLVLPCLLSVKYNEK